MEMAFSGSLKIPTHNETTFLIIEQLNATTDFGIDALGDIVGRVFLGDCRQRRRNPIHRRPHRRNGGAKMNINVENLTVSYQSRPAVHHVDMTFPAGCMYAIFGPNGAGKSTLLKAIMGLLPCNTGAVHWQNLQRRDIAYLPQQSDVDRSQPMSVFELAAMGLWYEIGFFGGINAAQRERVQAALKRVEMGDFANRAIGELSNGQFQRVLLARMLVQNAQFLLLDEPFNAVDAKTTFALLEVLRQENQNGKAIIAVLHDYEQVRAYFPHTLLIAREKVACGNTEDVLCDELLLKANALAYTIEDSEWCE